MYNKCHMCAKNIESAEDCKLLLSNGGNVETFCLDCFVKKQESA